MSRNRKLYDDDDLDDDYDDYDDHPIKPKAAPKKATSKPAPSKAPPAKPGAKPANDPKKAPAPAQSAVSQPKTVFTKAESTVSATVEQQAKPIAIEVAQPQVTAAVTVNDEEILSYISDDELNSSANDASTVINKNITLIVVGHVDAGKSTLVGHLLYLLGQVKKHTLKKYEKESHAIGKGSFHLAWVMDERQSEREHGVTIDIAERFISTKSKTFTILDAPGHKDFVPNMIKGATQADVAFLVVPATEGEYETAMRDSAQTKEHAILLKALGVNQVIVVVNKMDHTIPAPWDASRFYRIEAEMKAFLMNQCAFSEEAIRVIPVSGLSGENLLSLSEDCLGKQWYAGMTLQDGLEEFFQPPPRLIARPFRGIITSLKALHHAEYEVEVQILQGKLHTHRTIGLVSYSSSHCQHDVVTVQQMKRVSINSSTGFDDIATGYAGEKIILKIGPKTGRVLELTDLHPMVVHKGPPALKPVTTFYAHIQTMSSLAVPIIPGSKFEIYFKGIELQCIISKIQEVSENASKKPKCIPANKHAKVLIHFDVKTVVEPFATAPALGRFALRAKGSTVAVGICMEDPLSINT